MLFLVSIVATTTSTEKIIIPPKILELNIRTVDDEFPVGDKVDLVCKIERLNFFTTGTWKRQRTGEILEEKNFTADDDSTKRYHTLRHTINNVVLADKGLYWCKATVWNSSFEMQNIAYYFLKVRGK